MERVQDIFISDNNLKSQYVDNFLNENYNEAFNLINNNNLKTKRITIDFFNEISSKLYNMEDLYFQNIPEFLSDKLDNIQYFIDNLVFLGEWNADTIYKAYNLIIYDNSIYMYIGENPSRGYVPTSGGEVTLIIDTIIDSSSLIQEGVTIEGGTVDNRGILDVSNLFINSPWLKLEIRGEKGEIGIGINYRGNWSSSFSYNQYDSVFYNNSLWVCKVINQNIVPQNGNYWDEAFKVHKAKIEEYSSITNPYSGLICFEII